MTNKLTLGETLMIARKRRNLTTSELAGRLGIGRATIWRIENGKGNPQLSTLQAIAQELGGEIIFTESDQPKPLTIFRKDGTARNVIPLKAWSPDEPVTP